MAYIVIQVQSGGFNAGDFAIITLNKTKVYVSKNINNHLRGLHLVVINPINGFIESARCFDTYIDSHELDTFIATSIPKGYIVAAACKDDMVTGLSEYSKSWFAKMGSKEIWNLRYR